MRWIGLFHDRAVREPSVPRCLVMWVAGVLAGWGVQTAALGDDDPRDIRGFTPSEHGFAFTNRFTGPPIDLGPWSRWLPGQRAHGLCGGMSQAAAQAYLDGRSIDPVRVPPDWDSPTRRALVSAQFQSLGVLWWPGVRFAGWMAMPTGGDGVEPGAAEAMAREVARIRELLDRGRPAPIGLVYRPMRESLAIFRNQQVLGYALDSDSDGRVLVSIYDPNYPGRDDVRLILDPVSTGPGPAGLLADAYSARLVIPDWSEWELHGLFLMPYRPRKQD